jgi:S1-C subfamily serine protease
MDHCIYCGTRNPAGATFCLECGQTLYHEPNPPAAVSAPKNTRHWLVPVGVAAGSISLILLIVFGIYLSKKPPDAGDKHQDIARSTAAVLTIVGYENAGKEEAQGSGFILTGEGLGATNYHVLEGAQRAFAQCCNGRKFEIKSIEGADRDKDLVVFQLQQQGSNEPLNGLPTVALDTTGGISVGEKVIAIGSPQGLENTVSDGIISAIRSDNSVRYLQITAPISPGSSGSPVLNENGQVIGIATMQMREGQNLNFAVSAEYLQPLLNQHLQASLDEFRSSEQRQRPAVGRTASDVEQVNSQEEETLGPFTGQFAGTVHNDTANLSAGFALFLEDTQGDLRGCLAILRPLGGSGPIDGSASGPEVSFVATSNGEKITFTGTRTKRSITGTYLVEKTGGSQEEGSFSATKTKILDKGSRLDFANCPTDSDLQ